MADGGFRSCPKRWDIRPFSDQVPPDGTPPEKVTIKAGRESRRPYRQPACVIPVREDTWRQFICVVGTLPYAAQGHAFRYPDMGGEPVPSPVELQGVLNDVQRFAERVTCAIGPGSSR